MKLNVADVSVRHGRYIDDDANLTGDKVNVNPVLQLQDQHDPVLVVGRLL